MSASTNTANTASSRKKSCHNCARSKRRCDLRLPACSRCTSKSLTCEYAAYCAENEANEASALVTEYSTNHESLSNELLCPVALDPSMPLLFDGENGLSLSNPLNSPQADGSLDMQLNLLVDPQSHIGFMDHDRVRYCVGELKSYPGSWVHETRTAFIHPALYDQRMPQSIQDAYCASSMYIASNSSNEWIIRNILKTMVDDLLVRYSPSCSLPEHLAFLQSLIIFQIIRLFDGDIHQRGVAEQHQEILSNWTNSLIARSGPSSSGVFKSWESWVFEESIRRTIIVSLMVQGIYAVKKYGSCGLVTAVTERSFTGQAALWRAPSEEHWVKAWQTYPAMFISHMDFNEVLVSAKASDMEGFGIFMMVTYRGLNDVNKWISQTAGAKLVWPRDMSQD